MDTLNAYHRVQEDGIQYLVVPNYGQELKSFDLHVLLDHYCLVINEVPSAIEQADQESPSLGPHSFLQRRECGENKQVSRGVGHDGLPRKSFCATSLY